VEDRASYEWDLDGHEAWTIDCAVHDEAGLVYGVILPKPGFPPTE